MYKKQLYVMYDKISQEAERVFELNNDEEAIRTLQNTFNQSPHLKPTDYKLLHLGEIDKNTPQLIALEKVKEVDIIRLLDIKEKKGKK